jgi:hypothetical protein
MKPFFSAYLFLFMALMDTLKMEATYLLEKKPVPPSLIRRKTALCEEMDRLRDLCLLSRTPYQSIPKNVTA